MNNKADVVIIGGGHNGLTAATMLAKSGLKVKLLERNSSLGGLAAPVEFHPGFRAPAIHSDSSCVFPEIIDSLGLDKFGLSYTKESPAFFIADTPESKKKGILFQTKSDSMTDEIGAYSSKDAERSRDYAEFIQRIEGFVYDLMSQKPINLDQIQAPDLFSGMKTAVKLRTLGKKDMIELLRAAPMCVADWLNEFYETDVLKASLSIPAVWSSFTGPWSPSSTANLLMWECLSRVNISGGGVALVDALTKAAEDAGVEVRTETGVDQILVEKGQVRGVKTSQGEILSEHVMATCDPKTTFLKLIEPHHLSMRMETRVGWIRSRGTMARLHLALKGDAEFACRPDVRPEYARIATTLDGVEKSFDAVKYGEYSKEPTLDLHFLNNTGSHQFAPDGHSTLSVNVHFAPYGLRAGWNEETKKGLLENTMQVLRKYIPDIDKQVVASELWSPADIESKFHTSEGHVFHGELALDQLVMTRPTPECAQYRTPIRGLYLGGSGSHPGGGLTCASGAMAAQSMLR